MVNVPEGMSFSRQGREQFKTKLKARAQSAAP